jgi:hypothetical protein
MPLIVINPRFFPLTQQVSYAFSFERMAADALVSWNDFLPDELPVTRQFDPRDFNARNMDQLLDIFNAHLVPLGLWVKQRHEPLFLANQEIMSQFLFGNAPREHEDVTKLLSLLGLPPNGIDEDGDFLAQLNKRL